MTQTEEIEANPIIVQPIQSTLTPWLITGLIPDVTLQLPHKRVARPRMTAPECSG